MKYCSDCGGRVLLEIPPGDDRSRYCCQQCRRVHYQNPVMVVGCVPEWAGEILLCKRAIEPRHGTWTLPAGYLENGETVENGARRELMEEAGASALEMTPYGLYDIPHIGQIYMMFRTKLKDAEFKPGPESLKARLFSLDQIPWEELAFPVIRTTLENYYRDAAAGTFSFHIDNITQRLAEIDTGP